MLNKNTKKFKAKTMMCPMVAARSLCTTQRINKITVRGLTQAAIKSRTQSMASSAICSFVG
eukprot:15342582-Ditylum_brightwellii.AAC.1